LTLMISGHMQQPQHTPGPKPKTAKSKAAAPGLKAKATPSAKSASPGGANNPTKVSIEKDKGAADSVFSPPQREGGNVAGGLLHVKKGTEYSI